MRSDAIKTLLQLVGLLLIVGGIAAWSVPAACIVAGTLLVVLVEAHA